MRRQWSDRTKSVTVPIFPARLFARFDSAAPKTGLYLFDTPGLCSVFGGGQRVPIPDDEMAELRALIDLGFPCAAGPLPVAGADSEILTSPPVRAVLVDPGDPCRVSVPFPSVGEALPLNCRLLCFLTNRISSLLTKRSTDL